MTRRLHLFVWLLAAGLLAACQSAQARVPVTPLPTVAPVEGVRVLGMSSATPLPTDTPVPTPVPVEPPTVTLPPADVPPPTATAPPEITLLFSGQIVPGRCVQAGVDARGGAGYIYEEVRGILQGADLTVGTLNAALSDYAPMTGCIATFVLVGSSINADAMAAAGFDAMSVATNHIKNCNSNTCGERAFLDTLANLRRVGIQPVGAGETLEAALQPVVFEIRGVRFAIVSLGEIEPLAFAGEGRPGIAPLTEENLRRAIAAARAAGDVVIVMPHWGPEYSPNPNWNQRTYAQIAVDAGADLVVGNHAHSVQAMQYLGGVPVFYGLGNFVFDQTWDRKNQQSVLLVVRFRGASFAGYEFIPVYAEKDGTIHLAEGEEAAAILERIEAASTALPPAP